MRNLRWLLASISAVSMVLSGPLALAAGPAKTSKKKEAESPAIVREAGEMMRSSHPKETISEMYYRMAIHMSGQQKSEFATLLENKGALFAPEVSVKGKEILISQYGRELHLTLEEKKAGVRVFVNGQEISENELRSPKVMISKLEKLLEGQAQGKKTSLFWPLQILLPQAHAGLDITSLLVGAGVVVAGYAAYKYFWPGQAECTAKSQCCLVNNTFATGCCSEMNGTQQVTMGTGYQCPVGTSLNADLAAAGAAVAPISTINNSGQR